MTIEDEIKVNIIANLDKAKSILGSQINPTEKKSIVWNTNYRPANEEFSPRNIIYFGAPGTGKSWQLNQDKDELLGDYKNSNYERVTFHSNYSYANFVGTYKPIMKECNCDCNLDNNQKEIIQVLNNNTISAQEKYDILYEKFNGEGITRIPILLGLSSDENFTTKKVDGSSTDNTVEKNHGKAIRAFVDIKPQAKTTSEISYEYVPGPFIRILIKALQSARDINPKPYLLIIEEINRAEVDAVFGDIFQLLDRGDDNSSEYFIQTSEDLRKYLAKDENLGGKPEDYEQIKIPDNLFIWATMNSADQGVCQMDTAFKRRWQFKYISINHNKSKIKNNTVNLGDEKNPDIIKWNQIREAINDKLSELLINEDKLLGPYFLSNKIIGTNPIDPKIFKNAFKNKVIMYLFEDAAKHKREKIFSKNRVKNYNRYSCICDEFDKIGLNIFSDDIVDKIYKESE